MTGSGGAGGGECVATLSSPGTALCVLPRRAARFAPATLPSCKASNGGDADRRGGRVGGMAPPPAAAAPKRVRRLVRRLLPPRRPRDAVEMLLTTDCDRCRWLALPEVCNTRAVRESVLPRGLGGLYTTTALPDPAVGNPLPGSTTVTASCSNAPSFTCASLWRRHADSGLSGLGAWLIRALV